ncbi:hypothetical protein CXB45_11150 [Corynebacterium mastitidis]|uniref:Single-stranded DNA-binding protein n=2 Tax=Corynebacterium mastitidis TaxID=161890 RepID=A0A2N0X4N0_9CORY|nr:single-stranded DNA-binding protein [Corynebacterium mastitidis]PKF67657.1 hypothetical protein CXB45_11150 [Corynebacterium mastitidis]
MPTPRAEIRGNAVRDAKTGTDKNGKPYLMVTVGCNDSKKAGENEWDTLRSIFISVRLFGADPTMHVPQKGDTVNAFGRLYEEQSTGKDGKEYKNIVMDAEYVRAWPRKANQGWGGGQQAQGGGAPAGSWGAVGSAPQSDEQPPF